MNDLVLRGLLLTAIAQLAQTVANTDLNTIRDWKAWLVSLAIAVLYRTVRWYMGQPPPANEPPF